MGRPLVSVEIIVNLIGPAKTKTGRNNQTTVDANAHTKGIKTTGEKMGVLKIDKNGFREESNYTRNPMIIDEVL